MSLPDGSDKVTDRSRIRIPALLALANWMICIVLASLGLFLSFLNHPFLQILVNENFVIDAIVAVTFPTVGVVVVARLPRNTVGWIFCLIGLCEALSAFSVQYADYALLTRPGVLPGGAEMAWLQAWIWVPGICSVPTFLLLLFPDGRLLTRHWRWIAWLSAITITIFFLFAAVISWPYREVLLVKTPDQFPGFGSYVAIGVVGLVLLGFCSLASTLSLILRFQKATGVERRQLKWFTYTGVMLFLLFFGGSLLSGLLQLIDIDPTLVNDLDNVLQVVVFIFIPIILGIAILKHRLFDIDVIINRTLVYSVLTVTLALIYFGLVFALQALLRGIIKQNSDITIVVSTLAIAALFQPLRNRIQAIIDRRFYRRKYDAARTLEAFSATLRNEVDLNQLREHLITVVQETMQPGYVSLWLNQDQRYKKPQTQQEGGQS